MESVGALHCLALTQNGGYDEDIPEIARFQWGKLSFLDSGATGSAMVNGKSDVRMGMGFQMLR